jgi:hypothetical protein
VSGTSFAPRIAFPLRFLCAFAPLRLTGFDVVETAANFWRAALPRFVTSRAIQLRNRAFYFSNIKNS